MSGTFSKMIRPGCLRLLVGECFQVSTARAMPRSARLLKSWYFWVSERVLLRHPLRPTHGELDMSTSGHSGYTASRPSIVSVARFRQCAGSPTFFR